MVAKRANRSDAETAAPLALRAPHIACSRAVSSAHETKSAASMKARAVRVRYLLLAGHLALTACAHPSEQTMATDHRGEPEQRPADGGAVSSELRRMSDLADQAIRRQIETSGPAETRYAAAFFDVHAAMRPRFGPANAWLYQEREAKLASLARSFGAAQLVPPAMDPTALDAFFARVDELSAALTGRGLVVETSGVLTGAVAWRPVQVRGLALRVVDRERTIVAAPPYATSPAKELTPSFTALLFPPSELSTTENLTARVQPGALLGALDGVFVFALPPQHTADVDDGTIRAAVVDAWFGLDVLQDRPDLAGALGAQQVALERGVLMVTSSRARGGAVVERPPGAHALLWTILDGVRAERTVTTW